MIIKINLFNLFNLLVSFKVANCVPDSERCRSTVRDGHEREFTLVSYFHSKKLIFILINLFDFPIKIFENN